MVLIQWNDGELLMIQQLYVAYDQIKEPVLKCLEMRTLLYERLFLHLVQVKALSWAEILS